MASSFVYNFGMTARELLTSGVPDVTSPILTHDGYNESNTLSASTTPPCTTGVYFLLTLTAGAATINLASLTGANGTYDLTGLRIQALRIKNLGANSMTFAEGAANGIALACLPFTIPAGSTNPVVYQFLFGDAAPDVASGDRTIDVTGTGSQTAEISIWAG